MTKSREEYLKWFIGILFAALLFLLGAFKGADGVREELYDHQDKVGHPVLEERVRHQIEILERIEQKLDRQIDDVDYLRKLIEEE